MRRSTEAAGKAVLAILATLATLATGCGIWNGDETSDGCRLASAAELEDTIADGIGWLDRALQDDGSFWYEYDKSTDEFSTSYNHVRHAGTLMALMQVAADGGATADTALAVGDGGLQFVLDRLVADGDRTAFDHPGEEPLHLGSTALTIVALLNRRLATGDDRYDDLAREMGNFMLSLQRDDGAMWAGATGPTLEPQVGLTSTFYTGEAFFAFAMLANAFPGEGWEEAAEAVGRYIATARDEEEEIENPPLPDQWAAYGFAEMRTWDDLAGEELAYVRALVDRYHGRVEREIEREAARIGDGSGPPDETVVQARGAAFGTSVEALGALWRLSTVDPGLADLEPQLRDDLRCGAAILAARQFDEARAADWPRPEVVEGAWYDIDDEGRDLTRVDDQQHAVSGVLAAVTAVGR